MENEEALGLSYPFVSTKISQGIVKRNKGGEEHSDNDNEDDDNKDDDG